MGPGHLATVTRGPPGVRAAFGHHCSYLPMSGSVTAALAEELSGYETTKGSVKFPADAPLPEPILRALVDARLAELGLSR